MPRASLSPLAVVVGLTAFACACSSEGAPSAPVIDPSPEPRSAPHPAAATLASPEPRPAPHTAAATLPSRPAAASSSLGTPRPATPASRPGEPPAPSVVAPVERRRATRALMIHTAPRLGSEFRGKIPRHAIFERFEAAPGPDCDGEGWGRVASGGYVCLKHTEVTTDAATRLPVELADGVAPFFYARLRRPDATGQTPPAPRWRSRRAMRAGAPPEDHLQPEHDYAFVERRRFRDGRVLVTAAERVVRETDVRRMKPSEFAGRDLRRRPLPHGTTMTWSIEWPYAAVRAEPRLDAEPVARLELHAEALTEPAATVQHHGRTWLTVTEPARGFILDEHVRRWIPTAPPDDVGPREVWLDVDLDQQVLALRRGPDAEFVTLVSSGRARHATPTGHYRITGKWAYADMRSRADEPEDPYFVEGVPWVQYFRGRYALHGTFWHNRFGRRASHGCINLSAHDARWVYERTSPVAKPGWLVTNEHATEPGTRLRVRAGERPAVDRRRPLPG